MSTSKEQLLQNYQNQHHQLAQQLSSIGFIWPGTITRRYLTCGRDYCPCKTDPNKRHGPYLYWTTKRANKTVTKSLDPDEAALLEQWIENRRFLDAVVKEMKKVAEQAFAAALEVHRSHTEDLDL